MEQVDIFNCNFKVWNIIVWLSKIITPLNLLERSHGIIAITHEEKCQKCSGKPQHFLTCYKMWRKTWKNWKLINIEWHSKLIFVRAATLGNSEAYSIGMMNGNFCLIFVFTRVFPRTFHISSVNTYVVFFYILCLFACTMARTMEYYKRRAISLAENFRTKVRSNEPLALFWRHKGGFRHFLREIPD